MSNLLHFTGRLTKAPTLQTKAGRGGGNDVKYVNFSLIRNEFTGIDPNTQQPRPQRVVAPYFTMFGARAEAFCKHAMEGDQIILQARVTTDEYTDNQGNTSYSTAFIVENYDFGAPGKAKREYLNSLPPEQRKNALAPTMPASDEMAY